MNAVRGRTGLAFFLKYPQAGTVKTRLARTIGHETAKKLYECFLRDLLVKLEKLHSSTTALEPGVDVHLFAAPAGKISAMEQLLQEWGFADFPLHEQVGEDLGERMKNAFLSLFRLNYESCLLLGSDVPDVPLSLLRKAEVALNETKAVIGPAADGGYFLVGFRRAGFCELVFDSQRVCWSTDTVFAQSVKILEEQDIDVTVLSQWHDVDDYRDLLLLAERLRTGDNGATFTRSLIEGARWRAP